jgi:hypothetical protein
VRDNRALGDCDRLLEACFFDVIRHDPGTGRYEREGGCTAEA